jgi:peptidyl-tRNA hydrolase, PTH1 family
MENSLRPRIRAIVGLGNPGRDYEGTRHNLGFEVVDKLADGTRFSAGLGSYHFCEKALDGREVVLLKPTTYMNRSGLAVAGFAELFGYAPQEFLVICDDFNIPLGQLRLREDGSDGGHKGLASIIYHLNSDSFPRIRIGIGPIPDGKPAEEFVLERIGSESLVGSVETVERATQAAITWFKDGYDIAAARFNGAID